MTFRLSVGRSAAKLMVLLEQKTGFETCNLFLLHLFAYRHNISPNLFKTMTVGLTTYFRKGWAIATVLSVVSLGF
eukprot:scaffold468028_cov14-Prasinocladus_malaysianus.AAC.1